MLNKKIQSIRLFFPWWNRSLVSSGSLVSICWRCCCHYYQLAQNQLLLNCFSRWCQWVSMLILEDKCITFGTTKFSTSSLQFQPKFFINSKIMPPVKNGESFKYLGRFFNVDMDNKDHKEILKSSLQTMLKTVDSLYIHPKNKLLLYHRYILSKVSWLQIWVRHGFQTTWITLSLNISVSGLSFPFLPL